MGPWLVVALTVGGDQLAKWAIRSFLSPTESIPLIPAVLHLSYVQNTGAAFGLFRGYTGIFVLLSVLVATWVCLELVRRRHLPVAPPGSPEQGAAQAGHAWPTELGLSLILGGAIGNLIDRMCFGYVIDFIDVRVWPVFNLADSSITIGVGLLLWQALRHR